MEKIYLDYNASTPLADEVIKKMKPFLKKGFGNPSSSHWSGLESKEAIEAARAKLAAMLQCSPEEIIFTSGGSESNNLAIRGITARYDKGHIITSEIEHPAVLNVCRHLESEGYEVSYIPVDNKGLLKLEELRKEIRSDTRLITIMMANNEIGTIQPISEICKIAHKHDIPVHTDAAQAAGKIKISIPKLDIELLSLAGHKMYAPKGIGALYIKSGLALKPLLYGADHEKGLRPGTENVLEIVGLGAAAKVFRKKADHFIEHQKKIKSVFLKQLKSNLKAIHLNGHPDKCLPNTLNIRFPGIDADTLLPRMPEIAASAGAACHADDVEPSHVLKAIGLSDREARQCIRFSVGRETTEKEVQLATEKIVRTVQELGNQKQSVRIADDRSDIKLTQFTHGLGCACKLQPQTLEKIINKISNITDKNVLAGIMDSEDAAIYKINENTAFISTIDFFTPIVDDPYDFGRIAAANALSDIYAMGGTPLFALNIAAFPENRLPLEVLEEIIAGARRVAEEAGISILGGHTIEDNEPKFGLVANGIINPKKILKNKGAKKGDVIILTKPLGLGIHSTALKRNLLNNQEQDNIIRIMTTLNKEAAGVVAKFPVNSCTDVTGFGLLGHLNEILTASQVRAELYSDKIPVIKGTRKLVRQQVVPGGTKANLKYIQNKVEWNSTPDSLKLILADAQTSGGLLFTLPEKPGNKIIKELKAAGIEDSAIIGRIITDSHKRIKIL